MSMSDPIANMLTIIRNGYRAQKEKVEIPASKLKIEIARILKEEGYISNYKIIRDNKQNIINIELKYVNEKSVITQIKRISKPSLRIFKSYKDLPKVLNGLGIAIVSTSKGVMTDKEARKQKVGGEILCYVW